MKLQHITHSVATQPKLGVLAYWSVNCPMINGDRELRKGLS
jgi:hypothetical protein